MTRFATLFALLLVPGLAFAQKDNGSSASSAAGGAANDNLANAITITGDGEYLSSVSGATSEPGELSATCSAPDTNNSVWWVFTPAVSGPVTLDTDGSVLDGEPGNFTDTIMTIHTGSSHPLTEVACNDDDPNNPGGTGDFTSRISNFAAVAGTTYYIRVSTYTAARTQGEARLSFTGPALVANEDGPANRTLALGAARPNPSAGNTEMLLSIDRPQAVEVSVFDALGRRVVEVLSGTVSGDTELSIDTSSLRAGAYIVRAQGESFVSTRSITVVR